jgi:hypothetical protein
MKCIRCKKNKDDKEFINFYGKDQEVTNIWNVCRQCRKDHIAHLFKKKSWSEFNQARKEKYIDRLKEKLVKLEQENK